MDAQQKVMVGLSIFIVVLFTGFMGLFLLHQPVQQDDVYVLQFVSGTEYNIGDAGQVIVEARFTNGSNALVGCNASVWYPDKSLFLQNATMLSTSGNMFVEFTIPNVTGIYEYQTQCELAGSRYGVISKSFHVSEFQNDTSTKLNRVKAVIAR